MIKITTGCSNSGKSTWAHEQWLKDPFSTVIINRDKIRELLFSYTEETISEYYSRPDIAKLEKQVTKYEDTLINEALCENKTVIVDATHLSEEYIRRFEYWNVPLELVWFDVTLKEALTRNMGRNRKVDENIIKKQYNKYVNLRNSFYSYSFSPKIFNNNFKKPSVWVFDIDGTIAHMNGRNAYDWDKVGEDDLDTSVSNLFLNLNRETDYSKPEHIIFCSGRDEICRKDTLEWLKFHLGKFNDFTLLMRKSNDYRPDWIVKEELWEDICKDYYIEALIDDRNQVVRRARALGLKVFQVEYGNF